MDQLHNISSRPKTHIGSSSIDIAKPTSVFILTGTGNPEFGTEYVSIFVSAQQICKLLTCTKIITS